MDNEKLHRPDHEDSWFDEIQNNLTGPEPTAEPLSQPAEESFRDEELRDTFGQGQDLEAIINEVQTEPVAPDAPTEPLAATTTYTAEALNFPEEAAAAEAGIEEAFLADAVIEDAVLADTAPEAAPDTQEEASLDDILSGTFLSGLFADEEQPEQAAREEAPQEEPGQEPAEETAVQEQPPEAPEAPEESKPLKKRRPRMRKGYGLFGIPHILATAVWLFVIAAVGVSIGRLVWICCVDVLAFGKPIKSPYIKIEEDDSIEEIAEQLEQKGLIEYPDLFVLYMKLTKTDKLEVGDHYLTPMIYDYHAIKTALEPKAEAREVVEVVIPEGYTCQQIFALLEEKGVCSVKQLHNFLERLDDPDPNQRTALNDYWFLEGVPLEGVDCLEGYLFPDTYQFYKNHDPELVLEKMLDNFDYRYTDIMVDKIDALNDRLAATLRGRGYDEAYIEEHKFTIREVVIVASMIERETSSATESYDISSVIYNRLTNPSKYPCLNIDATVIYGMGGARIDPETGKTLPLTKTDLETDTPYNTYTRKGLIPGPISNPGRNSLNAALDPNTTNYYFYVFDPNAGTHLFAETEREHEQNKAKVSNNG